MGRLAEVPDIPVKMANVEVMEIVHQETGK